MSPLVIAVATLAGAGAGYLARRDHASYFTALNRAAIAFSGTLTLAAVCATALASLIQ
ncbi:hypothetical protein PV679_06310 [Streptomyces sp. AK02-01A]|nr:hypothetical protein [Streptomyces sp. AK02-01A]